MDKIFLYGMKADTLIGVYDWERERKQTLILDLESAFPSVPARATISATPSIMAQYAKLYAAALPNRIFTAGNFGGTYRPIDFK